MSPVEWTSPSFRTDIRSERYPFVECEETFRSIEVIPRLLPRGHYIVRQRRHVHCVWKWLYSLLEHPAEVGSEDVYDFGVNEVVLGDKQGQCEIKIHWEDPKSMDP